jgi:hypothetical protein
MTKIDINALELVEINGAMWHRITDPNGVDCLFPAEGAGSVQDLIDRFGDDDLDVVLQSATRYIEEEGPA